MAIDWRRFGGQLVLIVVAMVCARTVAMLANRLLDRSIIAILTVAVIFFAVDKFFLDPQRDEQMVADALIGSYGTKSIAVMPFVNMSSDPEQEYFSDGITEELLNLLAQVQDLRVISNRLVAWDPKNPSKRDSRPAASRCGVRSANSK